MLNYVVAVARIASMIASLIVASVIIGVNVWAAWDFIRSWDDPSGSGNEGAK